MGVVIVLAAVVLILIVLLDAFEGVVLPRRVRRPYRPTVLYYRATWSAFRALALLLPPGRRREYLLSIYGPLSMLVLFTAWALSLVVGFGLIHWGLETPLAPQDARAPDLGTYVYLSGTTFFTLGYGDLTAREPLGRLLTVLEAGGGFGFLAVVIGYMPVLYGAFSRRETTISMLDARAGSPPSAAELLLRVARAGCRDSLHSFLAEWERWCAELLESHLSYPPLCFYRCQHDNQSWVAALTAILDACALLIVGIHDGEPYQAQLTFAMGRHALVDLCLVFNARPRVPEQDRLPPERLQRLRDLLAEAGVRPAQGEAVDSRLIELRAMYEPFAEALGRHLLFNLPPVLSDKPPVDNWQTSAWMRRVAGINRLTLRDDEHFD
jgi:hypothetical protein